MKSNKVFEQTDTVLDEHGTIKESRKRIIRHVKSDSFVKVYLEDLSALLGIKQILHYKVLLCISKRVEYDTNKIIILKGVKVEIANEIGYNPKSVDNAISYLTSKGMLIRTERSSYILNPQLFFKGEEIKRSNIIKLILEYRLNH